MPFIDPIDPALIPRVITNVPVIVPGQNISSLNTGVVSPGQSLGTGVNLIRSGDGEAGASVMVDQGGNTYVTNINQIDEQNFITNNAVPDNYEALSSITGATGVVIHNVGLGFIFNHEAIVSNFTANFTNLELAPGYATNIVLILNQGASAYIPDAVQISGVSQTINWQGGSSPTGTALAKDCVSFSITNVGGTLTVLGQLVSFG